MVSTRSRHTRISYALITPQKRHCNWQSGSRSVICKMKVILVDKKTGQASESKVRAIGVLIALLTSLPWFTTDREVRALRRE